MVNHVPMSLSEVWNVTPKNKTQDFRGRNGSSTGFIHTAPEDTTSKVSCQPTNHDSDNRKKCRGGLWERALPSLWRFRSQGSFQDSPKNKWGYLFFVLCRNHFIICCQLDQWILVLPEIGTMRWLLCAPLLLPNPVSAQVMWAKLCFSSPLKSAQVCDQELEA